MKPTLTVKTRLAGLPAKPGVYIMRGANGRIIYVGKAVVLRNRVRSYFHDSAGRTPKTERLVADIADLEWIVTASELEALILECELIKRHKPHYNIRFKDDKRYPYIKVSWQEDYPRIYIVRKMLHDGGRYFGPFTSSWAVHQTLELLRRLFPYRTCNREITGKDRRPCLYYHIERCAAPCIGAISKEHYRSLIDHACLFLEGKQDEIVEGLGEEMRQAAAALSFERAAQLRDQIEAVSKIMESQRIVSGHLADHDFVGLARQDGQACVQVFFVRDGRLTGREYFVLTETADERESEVLGSFIKQFYSEAAHIPPEILLPGHLDDLPVILEWLQRRRGSKVNVDVPHDGEKHQIIQMATENAVEILHKLRAEWDADTNKHVQALSEIQQALGLPTPPTRIECYDISNIQGSFAVGSMVVFVKGVPSKRDYRRFRIKTVEGPNDVASMAEVLSRRFSRARSAAESSPADKENRWAMLPDLVILDGGKGQLNAARRAMQAEGAGHIPTAGLAKQNEEIYVPGRLAPIILPRDSQGLYLLQRIRDEAHRFAITYHRKLRAERSVRSKLDGVPGIGPKRRKALLAAFGSLEAIRGATPDQLAAVPGMNRRVAQQLLESL